MCRPYKILEQLYDAPIGINCTYVEANETLRRTAREREAALQKLKDSLTPNQKELLDNFLLTEGENQKNLEFKKFRYGFELGTFLMAELIDDYDAMHS